MISVELQSNRTRACHEKKIVGTSCLSFFLIQSHRVPSVQRNFGSLREIQTLVTGLQLGGYV